MRRQARNRVRAACTFFVVLGFIAIAACRETSAPPVVTAAGKTVVRSGTSFGFCAGYCWRELQAAGTQAVWLDRDPRTGRPERRTERPLDDARWKALVAAIDVEALRRLPDVIGCPDCADGGAEWIEVQSAGFSKKVTFDAGADLPEIQRLLDAARALRAEVPDPRLQ
jgi:hypothetical protein